MSVFLFAWALSLPGAAGAEENPPTPIVVQRPARTLRERFRVLAIEIGQGLDPGADVTDPFLHKGIDRLMLFDYTLRLSDTGLGLRAVHRHPPVFSKLAFSYNQRYDLFQTLGLGRPRDQAYHAVGSTPPGQSRGYTAGAAAVYNDYWGATVGFDRLIRSANPIETVTKTSSLGGGYSPLGRNNGYRWNYTWVGTLAYLDVVHNAPGADSHRFGVGASFGPVYQYGLDDIAFPGLEKRGIGPKQFRLDRFKTSLAVGGSQIGPSTLAWGADITAYASAHVRLSLGVSFSYVPAHAQTRFTSNAGVALIVDLLDIPI